MDIWCFPFSCFCLFISLLTIAIGHDPPCIGRDRCSCVTEDGKVIDLSSVGTNNGTSMFTDQQSHDGYMYSYNPCHPFTELACVGQSVCQIPPDRSTSFPAGDASSAIFTNDGINNIITYSSTDSRGTTRKSHVTLICDPNATKATLKALGEIGSRNYYLYLYTKCACPDECSNNPPTTNNSPTTDPTPSTGGGTDSTPSTGGGCLSIGIILFIVALLLSFVCFIGGNFFHKFGCHASVAAMVHNSSFWTSVPLISRMDSNTPTARNDEVNSAINTKYDNLDKSL